MPIPSKMLVKQEGRILLAIEAIQKDQTSSIREAARFHDVPQTTLHAHHSTSEEVGINWASSFVKRHETLQT
ncbi:hypothetical protein ASPBRDRAFT_200430 [Aspergillus brasiliensis CBS 101740]|uniref:HTH psq-type domain-containing protein n=1 Tax=Aspergillus brasiliensis (strain CBS 101740 / IMI 381727 / IBT 21946) TaxID=767769 RepID=A0A1L9U6G8_ASPBC|nr:hypothetical protein ASPBRDRAFT_200430 [Aspergillus brasiliensis CBS 101740]